MLYRVKLTIEVFFFRVEESDRFTHLDKHTSISGMFANLWVLDRLELLLSSGMAFCESTPSQARIVRC